jgi:hypothetical protein
MAYILQHSRQHCASLQRVHWYRTAVAPATSMNTTPHTRLLPGGLLTHSKIAASQRKSQTHWSRGEHTPRRTNAPFGTGGLLATVSTTDVTKPITGATRTLLHNCCHEQLAHVRIVIWCSNRQAALSGKGPLDTCSKDAWVLLRLWESHLQLCVTEGGTKFALRWRQQYFSCQCARI